jgi:Uncharacterized conserved protein, contains double-stranded beta-helix domain
MKPPRPQQSPTESPTGDTAASDAPPDIGKRVGAEVRQLRKARGMTLTDLAAQTGLSIGYLSQVERNLSAPSVKSLHDISRALGVSVSWFFPAGDEGREDERDLVVRAANRRPLGYDDDIRDYLLSPNLAGQLEMILSRFAPGASSGGEPYTHSGEEGGIVISGQFELWVGDRHFLLQAGDSFAFPSSTPHRYRNPGDVETVVVWAITPPSF